MVVEGNPHQLPGIGSLALTMHPKVAPFTFETHIRMEQDSYVDVIAEDENGKFFYNQVAIRSAGGCSAGVTYDADAILKEVGKMKILKDKTQSESYEITAGFVEVLNNKTSVLLEDAKAI